MVTEVDPQKEAFFNAAEAQHIALTYDDVRMRTRSGQLHEPATIEVSSWFSRNTPLKTPFVSAAMDTVTESSMAIAMAKMGGIGVVHAGLSPEEQRKEVRAVKLELGGLIEKPITIRDDSTVQEVLNEHGKKNFRTFPVLNSDGLCVGVMTGNDFDFCRRSIQVSVESQMTPLSHMVTVPPDTTIQDAYEVMQRERKKTLPVIDKDGYLQGMFLWSDVDRIISDNSGNYNVDEQGRLLVAAAVPTTNEGFERVQHMKKYLDVVVLDSADGDSYFAFKALKRIKENYPQLDVVVGNISEGESAFRLAKAGADGVKVGQGPGSICSTRREIGIGMPQVSAVYSCAKALRGMGVPVCADGGIRYHGDIPIALAVGADSVMMGSMLAGTNESPGDAIILQDGSRGKKYRGMGSASALRDSAAARDRYRSDGDFPLPEGVESVVQLKGPTSEVVHQCLLAVRKAMAYCKVGSIAEHQQVTRLTRITNAGLAESHPHSVSIIS